MNPLLIGVAVGIGCAFLHGCASMPPAKQYTPDSQDNCIENHVWGETTVSSSGPKVPQCAATGWYLEQRKLVEVAQKRMRNN